MTKTHAAQTGKARLAAAPLPNKSLVPLVQRLEDAAVGTAPWVGLISNPRSHRNRSRRAAPEAEFAGARVLYAVPRTHPDLIEVLSVFADESIGLLIVDGGDGTLRDVLTSAVEAYGDRPLPPIAVVPSGKTNALAIDLGIADDWSVTDAIRAAGAGRYRCRSPVEITRGDDGRPSHRGFLFGAGGFVRATELAQRTHRAGAFHGVAVGLSLVWSVLQTAFGSAQNPWRRGDVMTFHPDGGAAVRQPYYIVLASTLERLPLRLKPFGPEREGMKLLVVDAPPRRVLFAAPTLVAGAQPAWLARLGYRQAIEAAFTLDVDKDIILDGEHYPGGRLTVRRGEPLRFVVP